MNRCVKDPFSGWNGISDNNDVSNVLQLNYMIDFTSNGEEFSFSESYVHCMVDRFGNNLLASMNMWDQDDYIVFNTSIQDDEHSILINEWILIDIIKSVLMSS